MSRDEARGGTSRSRSHSARDIARGSQTNNQTGNNSRSGQNTRSQAPPGRDPGGSHTGGVNLGYQSSGGSDDYGIGSGGEFGASDRWQQNDWSQMARDQEEQDRRDAKALAERLEANRTSREESGNVYEPWTTSREDQFSSAFGGLDYSWVDPDSDFFTDKYGNKIGEPGKGLWDPFKGLSYDQWNTMLDWGEFDAGPIGNYSGWPGGGGGGGWGSGWGGYGGGGGGGGYGYSGGQDPMQQGYQRGQVGPGTLQEQVNQIYLGMSNTNPSPGFQKKRGGIVSLLGLN
jgi:hypothetical protein